MTTESTEEKTWMRIGIQIAEELFLLCCQLSYHTTTLCSLMTNRGSGSPLNSLSQWDPTSVIGKALQQKIGARTPAVLCASSQRAQKAAAPRACERQPRDSAAGGTRSPERAGTLEHKSREADVDCVLPGTGKHGQQKTSLKNPANTISIS